MKLNPFLWNNFRESARGREWIEFFAQLPRHYEKRDPRLKAFIDEWTARGLISDASRADAEIDEVLAAIEQLQGASRDGLIPKQVESGSEADAYFREVGTLVTDEDEEVDLFGVNDIPGLSIALYCLFPRQFFPYYFYRNFHALQKICDEFGIFLPPVPAKQDYDGRYYYYLELCKSLREYWDAQGFPPEHLPAFLYGFAPEAVGMGVPKAAELPKPYRAWFIGGGINGNGDFDYLDQITDQSQTYWQGNKDTEEGDIVVLYCLTPRSHIHSIWRAIRPGAVEPFFSFYGTVSIGYPQKVKPLTLSEIKADPLLSQMPLVKGNMQGINGRQIQKQYYDRLLALLEKKGTDLTPLPRLENIEAPGKKFRNEREVEEGLLEPLLKELGFSPADWERQVSLKIGRSEKVIPDYLLLPERDRESRSVRAAWVWEAKLSVPSHEQLRKDFEQATSYARQVGAAGVGLISKEGVWLASIEDDYSLKSAKHRSAQQLHEIDHLSFLRELAGKKRLQLRKTPTGN